ncbi:DUF4142 domain-containing protein [Chryseobacterium koreense]|uniref:DUF4142 domain-containing protein n=1 Tax=Chryseobacterium koreense TaxID=232216 RepID=UPI0026EF80E2|nr:DUF4142 domain-containing protein [Chryseobacterium koreense]
MKNFTKLMSNSLLASALFLVSYSCKKTIEQPAKTETTTETTTTPEVATPAPEAAKLTDPEIASIAVTANQIDVNYAEIALKKSTNKEVTDFAKTMAKDHKAVIEKAVALVKKLNVTPQDNPTTQSLLKGEADVKAKFETKSGADFDKAYVDNEVEYHKAVISVVENDLIPNATNPELKALLESALPLFKEHLAHAEMVQKNMK